MTRVPGRHIDIGLQVLPALFLVPAAQPHQGSRALWPSRRFHSRSIFFYDAGMAAWRLDYRCGLAYFSTEES